MKKIKSSVIAKLIAWILLAGSAVCVGLSAAAAVVFEANNYYSITLAEAKENAFEQISDRYSAMVLGQMEEDGVNEKYFADKNFKYGIIQADNIKELSALDLNDEKTYLERNFTEEVELEDLNIFECYISDDTYFSYRKPESIFGSYYICHSETDWTQCGILGYVYDENSGIFYYHCDNGKYYPVKNILFTVTEGDENTEKWAAIYEFDDKKLAYRLVTMSDDDTIWGNLDYEMLLHVYCSEDKQPQEDALTSEDAMKELTAEEVHFNKINNSVLGYSNWMVARIWFNYMPNISTKTATEITITAEEGGEELVGEEFDADLTIENLSEVSEELLANASVFYADMENNSLFEQPQGTVGVNYYVVSYVPETLKLQGEEWKLAVHGGAAWSEGDLYVQTEYLLEKAYELRYQVFAFFVVYLIILIASFVYLTAAAGHRRNVDEISGTWAEKIPLEIFWVASYAVEAFLIILTAQSAEMVDDVTSVFWLAVTFFFVLCGGCLAMGCYLDFVVRVKLGKWWRNTLIWRIYHWLSKKCKRLVGYFLENTKLLWKVVLGYGALSFVELILIIIMVSNSYDAGIWIILLLLFKLGVLAVLLKCAGEMSKLKIAGEHIAAGDLQYQIDTSQMYFDFKKHGENLNSLSDGLSKAVDARMKSEHFKTELITNVSHDIKTPLTSIINYVDLLKKEDITNEAALEYIEVLDRQSARLKKLIEDLMEASKASTGNLTVNFEKLEAGVFMVQTVGEFEEKTSACDLELVIKKPEEPVYIMADGRHFWRVIDNLMNNICKYAQPKTRVYINLEVQDKKAYLVFRNTSKYPLNISSEELMERFVRGDSSRNTEGNGLGLSIAQSLMELMHGKFELIVDGDLFKVVLTFDVVS